MALTLPGRYPLGVFPTPLHRADRLGRELGIDPLWLKRDDLSGFSWGGNKVRTVEGLLAEAIDRHITDLVVSGGPSSNFAAALAAGATVAGLAVHQVAYGDPPSEPPPAMLAGAAAGATIRFTGDDDRSTMETRARDVAAELAAAGRRPMTIPRGGANAVGSSGFFLAAIELQEQLHALGTSVATVVLPVGSGGSVAGFLAGSAAVDAAWKVVGLSVSRPVDELRPALLAKALDVAAHTTAESVTEDGLTDRLELHDCRGEGFGRTSLVERQTSARLTHRTGLIIDPTYNAKALHWLADTTDLPTPAVYWHTGGALSATPRPENR